MRNPLRLRSDDRSRREDIAFLPPLFGVVVLLPPILNLFAVERLVFGLPLEVIYLFMVWTLLILGAVLLSRYRPLEAGMREHEDERQALAALRDPAEPGEEA